MSYFVDFNVDKNLKIGITSLLGTITQRPDSHKGGWTKLLKCQFVDAGYSNIKVLDKKDLLSNFDIIVFDLGAEFSGSLNMFGGLNTEVYNRLKQLSEFKGLFFSWNHKLPSLMSLESRRQNKSTCKEFIESPINFLQIINESLCNCKVFSALQKRNHLLIGDSHTPSIWNPSMEIYRQDGRTLFGSIKNDLFKDFNYSQGLVEVTLYMGNIDIRHHLMRQENPWNSIQNLCTEYEEYIAKYFSGLKVNINAMLPIENESRKLPKTGYYKGTPFAGKWNERAALVEIFNRCMKQICLKNEWQLQEFPTNFKNDIGELPFEVMEKPKSVHLSPMSYMWDLDSNVRRW